MDELVVYEGGGKTVGLPYDAEKETIWATRMQMAEIFGVTPQSMTIHLKRIFESRELDENRTSKETLLVQMEGGREIRRKVRFYNLDAIISVGYRVNSRKATDFRVWATGVLRRYIVDGVAVNENRLKQLDMEKLRGVEGAIGVVKRLIAQQELNAGEAAGVLEVLTRYSATWEVLRKYDEGRIVLSKGKKAKWRLDADYALGLIVEMREKTDAGELFGKVRSGSFDGVVGAIYQTFEGRELYGTVAEKAANLLYLIIKDHPFYDGNKRIGAFLFVVFLTMNDFALAENGECKISDRALVAIALLIAESNPKEKELIVALVGRLLGK